MAHLTTLVTFVGQLATNPLLRFGEANHVPYVDLVVLVNENDRDGEEWPSTPTRHRVRAFGQMAQNINTSLATGNRVVVVGRLTTEAWTDTVTKEARTTTRVIADVVAPSLEFATTSVTRNPRRTPSPTPDREVHP
jgi:single-strand DNA-binding protein